MTKISDLKNDLVTLATLSNKVKQCTVIWDLDSDHVLSIRSILREYP